MPLLRPLLRVACLMSLSLWSVGCDRGTGTATGEPSQPETAVENVSPATTDIDAVEPSPASDAVPEADANPIAEPPADGAAVSPAPEAGGSNLKFGEL